MTDDGTTPAPAGQVWVCGACGKTSRTRHGFLADNTDCAQPGWDESCMLNAVLCWERKKDGMWFNVTLPEPCPACNPMLGDRVRMHRCVLR